MKFLKRILVDDFAVVDKLAKNKRIKDYKLIAAHATDIKKSYVTYRRDLANVSLIAPLGYGGALADALQRLYKNEVKGLEFISTIRDKMSVEGCPMCGKPANGGEVDHLLEKATYSEYSFFSYNLVPGCTCNNNRIACSIAGTASRPLHPYFDKAMRRRLARASIVGSFCKPSIGIEPVGGLGYMKPKVVAHLTSVVVPNGIEDWFAKRWEGLLLDPLRALILDEEAITPGKLVSQIKRLRSDSDFNQSMNSWSSMWYSGLLANTAIIHGLCKLIGGMDINLIPDIK